MDGLTSSERAVLDAVGKAGPDGILLSALRNQLSGSASIRDVNESIRMLMTSQKVNVARAAGGTDHVITVKRPQVSENFSVVLSVVRAAGASGIDVPGIMSRSKVPKAEVTKALNAYLQQQAVRETRCFSNKAKKLYIAAEFEPSADVTGGTFYTETRDLDLQLIDSARSRIAAYIRSSGAASVAHLKAMLDKDARIAQRRMSMREVGTLARTLHLDGVLKRARSGAQDAALQDVGDRTYTLAVSERMDSLDLGVRSDRLGDDDPWAATFPCTSCPQLATCQRDGVITPLTCAYLRDWMNVDKLSSSGAASGDIEDGGIGGRASAAAAAAAGGASGGHGSGTPAGDTMGPPTTRAGGGGAQQKLTEEPLLF